MYILYILYSVFNHVYSVHSSEEISLERNSINISITLSFAPLYKLLCSVMEKVVVETFIMSFRKKRAKVTSSITATSIIIIKHNWCQFSRKWTVHVLYSHMFYEIF